MQAYVDTSYILAIAFDEPGAAELNARFDDYANVASSNLLEAELVAAFRREGIAFERGGLDRIRWVMPERALSDELGRVFAAGYLRGADAWHVACALYMVESPAELAFLTLDTRQRDVAAKLGFPTP